LLQIRCDSDEGFAVFLLRRRVHDNPAQAFLAGAKIAPKAGVRGRGRQIGASNIVKLLQPVMNRLNSGVRRMVRIIYDRTPRFVEGFCELCEGSKS